MRHRNGIILSAIFMTMLTHPVLLGGCRPTAPYTGVNAVAQKAGPGSLTQVQLQALVMNFADVYVMTTWQAYDAIRSSTTDPKRRALAQYFKVITTSNAMTIAAGRNSIVNLLDMLVFVSL